MKCAKCNHEYDSSLAACPVCGEPTPAEQAPEQPAAGVIPEYHAVRPPAEVPIPAPVPENSGAAPLILGILSLMIPFIGVVLGIIAIVMGGSQRRAYPPGTAHHGLGQAGWVLGIVGLVLQALLIIWFFAVIGFALNMAQNVIEYSLPYSYNYSMF